MSATLEIPTVTFQPDGLVPAVMRDADSGRVLMLAYMNRESLERTATTGETWFWSRSRQELWHKGATSGNVQRVVALRRDCDGDALLVDVAPSGPSCHTGAESCFGDDWSTALDLGPLVSVLKQRLAERPAGSYSTYLFNEGKDKILKKIGEEATEVVIAAKGDGKERLVSEVTDLIFHLSALLVNEGIELSEVSAELGRRASR
ncbi:MAG TPA: bifunctional phosphoribosyl-AMP cyclohydrolase/phosphoribosyl-ATP diphosphatase HisIE [Thermoanaerobaculia bacterium]|nr:bifunctional phosphoribosyl-AMP cyclohydrolase/phosphoribosyl-ATP diphosphatase HisIE [Thermoanaerobaculia bacterium]